MNAFRIASETWPTGISSGSRPTPHPSLHFKPAGRYWSVRVGIHFRALAIRDGDDFIWFWIGTHAEYYRLLRS